MDAPAAPQILITIAARFGRVSWKYSSLAYALILKDVGVLTQTLYLMATDMGLGGCAIGSTNIDLFAKMTGIEFHVEGPVGQFALGSRHDIRDCRLAHVTKVGTGFPKRTCANARFILTGRSGSRLTRTIAVLARRNARCGALEISDGACGRAFPPARTLAP